MRSIRAKIFLVVISFLLIMSFAFSFYAVNTTTNYRKLRINELAATVQYKSERINTYITEMEQDALSLANAGSVFYLYTDRSQKIGNTIVLNNIRTFPTAAGGGIWFDPYRLDPSLKAVSFYACRSNSSIPMLDSHYSMEITSYLQQSWYRLLIRGLKKRGDVKWSPPYLDTEGTKSLVITVGTGIYNAEGERVGLATIDWRLQNVIRAITQIKPTGNSFVFMCDPEHDYILANTYSPGRSEKMTGRSLRYAPWYRNLKKATKSEVAVIPFKLHGAQYYSFARVLRNGMMLSVQVPAAELFALINLHNRIFVTLFVTFSLLMLYCALIIVSRYITAPIRNLMREITRLGQGNLDHRISESSKDEIGSLARTFNRMSDNLKEYIDRLAKETSSRERITSELEVAAQIQRDILPNRFPPFPDKIEQFDLYAEMHAAKEVAGDFYDFFMIDPNRIAFVIADVSGKGIPAAMFMMSAKTTLKNNALSGYGAAKIIERTNKALCENNDVCMFVTMFFGIYDLSTKVLHYVNGGHNPPLLKREGTFYDWLRLDKGFALGIQENREYHARKLRLRKGDRLFCYTDGVTEAVNSKGEIFGEKRLLAVMNRAACKQTHLRGDLKRVMDSVREFAGDTEQSDDVTMLILEIKE